MAVPKEERVVEIIVNGTKANASLKEMSAAAAVLSNQVAKIAADDPKRGELIAELQTMRQRLGDAQAEVKGLLTAQQQAAAAAEQLAAAQAATVAEQQRAIVAGQATTASYNQMRTAAGLLEQQLHGLGANDPGRAALLTDLQTLRGRLEEARTAMGGVIKTEAQQRAEAEALRQAEQQLAEAEARRQQEQVELVVNGQRVTASMREMRGAAGELERQLDELSQDDPARGPLIQALRELKGRIHDVQQEVAGVSETTSHMRQVMAYAFGSVIGGGIEGVLNKVVETGKEVFTTTAKFEKYGAVIKNALGSESLANKALADIQQLAARTPFSVDELTGSFLKFVNRGLEPTMAEMEKFGDLAASQGKDFDQLTEAVLDAATGEFERLKEFGIAASKSGNQVSLSFKGVNQTVSNTPEAIKGALLAFGEMKGVAGGMALVAGTLDGQLSNLGDTADQTAVEWGGVLKPAFVGVLTVLGFLLGLLKELPGFIRDNRGLLLQLAGAMLLLNSATIGTTISTLAQNVATKASLIWKAAASTATKIWTGEQWALNAAMEANPLGMVIAAVVLLAGAIMLAYDKSERFRSAVQSLWRMFDPLIEQMKVLLEQLREGLVALEQWWDSLGTGIPLVEAFGQAMTVLLNPLRISITLIQAIVDTLNILWQTGKFVASYFGGEFQSDIAGAFKAWGQHFSRNVGSIVDAMMGTSSPADAKQQLADYTDVIKEGLAKAHQAWLAWQQEVEEKKKAARLEALKNEEADLKERLARVAADTKAEMRLKQQLVTNEAKQKLENDKLTEAERRIILAEAEQQRVKLAQEFYEKQARARKAAQDKAAAEALKARLAEIEAEQHATDAQLKLRHAAAIARGDERGKEMSEIWLQGELKVAALTAAAKKEIAQLQGTAAQKQARARVLEQELAADVAAARDKARTDQQAKQEKWLKEDTDEQRKFIDGQLEALDEYATKQQAAFDVMLGAGLLSQQEADQKKYEARQAAFERELALIEASLGKESEEYKKLYAAQIKDQADHAKRSVKTTEDATKAKKRLQQMEMQTAGDVLQFGLDLLDQDAEARKKHHSLYTALAAAKIIVDGTKEVQQIWEYQAENPLNGETMGAAGIILGGIQTAVAVARTAVALKQVYSTNVGGDSDGSYAQGGATGTGAGLAVSPWGRLMQASGMAVGPDGRLRDNTGFAVAGVVHEDEYVIPKWQLQDPQVAAVAQWLEARRLRGFADGGHTSASSGAALPVAAASPASDGEKLYAVLVQMLDANQAMVQQLGEVATWQRELKVINDLRGQQQQLDEYNQVRHKSAIRSKK